MRDIRPKRKIPRDLAFERDVPFDGFSKQKLTMSKLTGSKVPLTSVVSEEPTTRQRVKRVKRARDSVVLAPAKLGRRERRLLLFLVFIIVVASALAIIIFLPRAEVKLTLRSAPLLVEQTLHLTGAASSTDTGSVRKETGDGATIEAVALQRSVDVAGEIGVSGSEVIGEKAQGTVNLVNLTFEPQSIRENSRLTTPEGLVFYMQRHAIIPAAEDGIPGGVTVAVQAAEAGGEYNIESQRLDFVTLDDGSRQLVYAGSATVAGGSGETVAVVVEADILAAQQAAGGAARADIEGEIRANLPEGHEILEETWQHELTSFSASAKVGERVEALTYQATVISRVFHFSSQALEDNLRQVLTARVAEETMLLPGPISFNKEVSNLNWETAEADLSVRITHATIPDISLPALIDSLAGREVADAVSYLEVLEGIRSVSVDVSPFWVRSIPRIHRQISVELIPEAR